MHITMAYIAKYIKIEYIDQNKKKVMTIITL